MMFKDIRLKLDRLRVRQSALSEVGDSTKSGKLLSFYTRVMTKVVDCERCSVFINDPGKDKVWLTSGTGVEEREIEVPKEGSIAGKVIASGQPIVEDGLENKPGPHRDLEEKTGFVTRTMMCVPIKSPVRDEVTGAFQLLNKTGDEGFTGDDLSLALEIAEHLQDEVERIFLDQEILGLTERLYGAARNTVLALVGLVVVLLLVGLLALSAYIVVPAVIG